MTALRISGQMWRRILWIAGSALAAALLVTLLFVFYRPTLTQGSSMSPTLNDGDWCMARVWDYTPVRGDVVIIRNRHIKGRHIVKRVIGLPGDVIDIDYTTGEVSRNGRVLDEPYVTEPTMTAGDTPLPLTVPANKVFVLGDNRNHSTDSRTSYTGMIDESIIEGKVVFRLLPLGKYGRIE